jgi:hypothetical protein
MNSETSTYHYLVNEIGVLLQKGREQAAYAVNTLLVQTYWLIGRHIVEFEQGGKEKAEYGSNLLDQLSKDLTQRYGKGFSRSNLFQFRQFYIRFSKIQTLSGLFEKNETVSHKLSWSQ